MSISFSTRSASPGVAPILVLTGSTSGTVNITLTAGVPQVSVDGVVQTLPAGLVVSGYDAAALTTPRLQATDDGASSALTGTTGSDTLNGGGGNDVFSGGAGDDLFLIGSGSSTVTGGAGTDTFRLEQTLFSGTIDMITDVFVTIRDLTPGERIVFAGHQLAAFADNSNPDIPAGTEYIRASNLAGGNIQLTIETAGLIRGTAPPPAAVILDPSITLDGFRLVDGNTLIYQGVTAGQTLTGGSGNDSLSGGTGADSVVGNGGRDTLRGGGGDDTLSGGDGDDVLYGGAGHNTIQGGGGSDVVVIDANSADLIFSELNGGRLVTDTRTGGADTNLLVGVEVVVLRDGVIALTEPNSPVPFVSAPGFDESFYLSRYPDAAQAVRTGTVPNGYVHYLLFGYADGYQPANGFVDTRNPFDEAAYLARNPDVAAAVRAGVYTSGLAHYAAYGYQETGRVDQNALTTYTRPYSDDFYLLSNPDVAAAVAQGVLPNGYAHYVQYGRAEGRPTFPPSPGEPGGLTGYGFNEDFYLKTYPDVAQAVADGRYRSGYEHFYEQGLREGRDPNPFFDAEYYAAHNPDVVAAVARGNIGSLLEHYTLYGWREGRDPSGLFDTSAYLADNPDVAAAGVNPLVHALNAGLLEGRHVTAVFDYFG